MSGRNLIDLAADKYGVPASVLRAVGIQESGLNPNVGASQIAPAAGTERGTGMMQLTPSTAKSLGVNPNDPAQALMGAAAYLRQGYDKFGNWDDAVRYYHGGPDTSKWGPRTADYHKSVAGKLGNAAAPAPAANNPFRPGSTQGAKGGDQPPAATNNPFRVATVKPAPSRPTQTSQSLGLYQGFMRPFDNAATWLDAGLKKAGIPMDKVSSALGLPTTEQANADHKAYIQAQIRKGIAPGRKGDFVGSAVGTGIATAALKNPWAAGAVSGALDTSTPKDAKGVAIDTLTGGIAGGVASKLLKGVGNAISPRVDDAVAVLKKYGVQMTPGQILGKGWRRAEDAVSSWPVVGELIKGAQADTIESFNRAATNDVLASLGKKVPDSLRVGRDTVDFAHSAISQAYDDIIPKLKPAAPNRAFVGDLKSIAGDLAHLPAEKAKQFKTIMNSTFWHRFMGGTGAPKGAASITGAEFKEADTILGQEMRRFMKSPDPDHQLMGQMFASAQSSLRNLMERSNPGQVGSRLAKANQAWAKLLRVEGAAASLGAKEGVFTPAQLASAVKRFDESLRKNQYARGKALLQTFADAANARLPQQLPDSGTATRELAAAGAGAFLTGGLPAVAGLGMKGAPLVAPLAPYMPGARKLVTPLMTSRPDAAKAFAELLAKGKRPLVPLAATGAVEAKERTLHGK